MTKSIQQTIKDCSKAMKQGVVENILRQALFSDGWKPARVDQIIRWAKVYVEKTKGENIPYPDTTVITVEPDYVT